MSKETRQPHAPRAARLEKWGGVQHVAAAKGRPRLVLLLIVALCSIQLPWTATAQEPALQRSRAEEFDRLRRAKVATLEPEKVSAAERHFRWYENRPIYNKITQKGFSGLALEIGGLPSGSGFAGGLNYHRGRESRRAHLEAKGLLSTKLFKRGVVEITVPGPQHDPPVSLAFNAEYQDYTDRRFFGLGPESDVHRQTFYRDENRRFGVGLTHESRWLGLSAGAMILNGSTRSGQSDPSTDEVFDSGGVPGIGAHSEWIVPGGQVEFRLLDNGYPPLGTTLGFSLHHFADQRGNDFGFTRWTADIAGHIPLGVRSRRLSLHARTSYSLPDAGSEVPFQLMETLGGARSIRGMLEYRFRDVRHVLLNAEYRWEIWTFTDWVFFVDMGKVFPDGEKLSLSNLETGYGTGLRIHAPNNWAVIAQYARTKETYAIHLGSGPRF
jgi:hypothetical protein